MVRLWSAAILLLLAVVQPSAVSAAEGALTNEAIIAMVRAGLDDEIVVSKIRASRNAFDTSPAGLTALRAAGVSIAVVKAMIEASGPSASAQRASDIPDGSVVLRDRSGFKAISGVPVTVNQRRTGEQWIPIYGYFAPNRTAAYLAGVAAPSRTTQTKPIFYSRIEPQRLRLVWLGTHGNSRYVSFADGRTDREVQIKAELVQSGIYRIAPVNDLAPGEYAFLTLAGNQQINGPSAFWRGMLMLAQGGITAEAFDFGVDRQEQAASPAPGAEATN